MKNRDCREGTNTSGKKRGDRQRRIEIFPRARLTLKEERAKRF